LAFIEERVGEIERKYAHFIRDLLVLRLTEETLRLILVLPDATTLRVTERWKEGTLTRYSYYWIDTENSMKSGWDNAPHHKQLENFPHHKHVGNQVKRIASYEVCLEDVMRVLEKKIKR